MNSINKKHITGFLLATIIIVGALLRFYKLDWGQGLFTHPDEYHITASVDQLSFPNQMHPHFFSYGTATIYLIYFTQEILKHVLTVLSSKFLVSSSFLLGRFYSALFSTLTIFIVYGISRTFLRTKLSLLAAFLVALTPGLIQQAHFATPESALTFFLFLCLLLIIKFLNDNKLFYLILASIALGFALGVKISSIVFLLPIIATIAFRVFPQHHLGETRSSHLGGGEATTWTPPRWSPKTKLMLKLLLRFIRVTLISAIVTFSTFVLAAPYVFFDYPAFMSNLNYEGSLAFGNIPVFYTRQFIDTIPTLFQLEKILPYALGPGLLVLGVLGFFLIVFKHLGWWRKRQTFDSSEVDGHLRGVHSATSNVLKNDHGKILLLITIAFLSLFIPSAFLFAKWTRFIAPTFPFFAIFATFLLQELQEVKKIRILFYSFTTVLMLLTTLWVLAFFSIYRNLDIRITASQWLELNAADGSSFLVEGGNTVDLPLRGNFQRTSLDFYALEDDPLTREKIIDALYSSDYFLVQSRRVFMNHQRLPDLYPRTAKLYDSLFNGKLGFKQIKEFHSYPRMEIGNWKLEIPDEAAEETWSVFDHPVVRVFKKNRQLLQYQYRQIFEGKES